MSTRERDAGMSSRSKDDKGKRPDVGESSPPMKASNTTSKDDDINTDLRLGQSVPEKSKRALSDKMNEPSSSLEPYVQQESTPKRAKNDEIADIPFPDPPVPQPPSVPGSSSGSSFTDPRKFFNDGLALYASHDDTLPPIFLLPLLKPLGMSEEIHEDKLGSMLHFSGYLDDSNANMNCDQFILFESDFKLLQAFQVLKSSKSGPAQGRSDLILLKRFFAELEGGMRSGFTPGYFISAFDALGMSLKFGDYIRLERYSSLPPSDPVNFEQFIRSTADEVLEDIEDPEDLTISIDRNQRYHRILLFVSMYIRRNQESLSSSPTTPSSPDATPPATPPSTHATVPSSHAAPSSSHAAPSSSHVDTSPNSESASDG